MYPLIQPRFSSHMNADQDTSVTTKIHSAVDIRPLTEWP